MSDPAIRGLYEPKQDFPHRDGRPRSRGMTSRKRAWSWRGGGLLAIFAIMTPRGRAHRRRASRL